MNFHGLFGAMMGERGGGGYAYTNPYEQPPFPSALQAHHQPQAQHHQDQDKGDPYAKLDPYATIKTDPYESSKSDHYGGIKDPYGAGKSDPYSGAAVPKTDPYGSIAHMRNSEFFNHNLYQQAQRAENNHLGKI